MSFALTQLASFVARNYNSSYSSSNSSDIEALLFGGVMIFYLIVIGISLLITLFIFVSCCKLVSKAGEPWWSQLIPFYNSYVLCKIVFGNGWLFLCFFVTMIPFIGYIAGMVFFIYFYYQIANVFGHGIGYTLGLLFLPVIFFPMLAFGSSQYHPERANFFGKEF